MKKYKNAIIALGLYIIALLATYGPALMWQSQAPIISSYTQNLLLGIVALVMIIGIFFAFRSNRLKESSWMGTLLALFGILVIFLFLLLKSVCGPYGC